jgi:hypothetical protein
MTKSIIDIINAKHKIVDVCELIRLDNETLTPKEIDMLKHCELAIRYLNDAEKRLKSFVYNI